MYTPSKVAVDYSTLSQDICQNPDVFFYLNFHVPCPIQHKKNFDEFRTETETKSSMKIAWDNKYNQRNMTL